MLLVSLLAATLVCAEPSMNAPPFACKRGQASASVPLVDGASYQWTIEGGTLVAGAGTNRITLALGDAPQAKVTATITTPDCTRTSTGTIRVRDPLVIRTLNVPQSAEANAPVTITWSYDGEAEPVSQLLTGSAFAAPVSLSGTARSYTFNPQSGGNVELHASYATAIHPPAARPSKRRAVAPSIEATACPNARAAAQFEIRGCNVRRPFINAPREVDLGVPFTASVFLETGESAYWTVTNAVADTTVGGLIEVRADQEGDVGLAVRVERDATCFAESSASIAARIRPPECPVVANAHVELGETTCGTAAIHVTFTGTPPFRGKWKDGETFHSVTSTMTRNVYWNGSFEIAEVRDATGCAGTTSGGAVFKGHRGEVTLEAAGSCAGGKVIAKFTGVPPFSGTWSTGESFTTNESELVLEPAQAGAVYSIHSFHDSLCPSHLVTSNSVQIGIERVLKFNASRFCSTDVRQPAFVNYEFNTGEAPFIVEWSDGVVTQFPHRSGSRSFPASEATYDIVRATAGDCVAKIDAPPVAVTWRPPPEIDPATLISFVCPGTTGAAEVKEIPPGATLQWTIFGGEILSGQGTSRVTYRGDAGFGSLRVKASYPDGECSTEDHAQLQFGGEAFITNLQFSPSMIKIGGASIVTFSFSPTVKDFAVYLPPERMKDLEPFRCDFHSCRTTYVDTVGLDPAQVQPEPVPLEIRFTSRCAAYEQSAFETLWIRR